MPIKKQYIRLAIALLIAFVLDQGTKAWAIKTLKTRDIELLPILNLSLAYNQGVSFGMLDNISPFLLIALTIGILLILTSILWKEIGRKYPIILGVFIGSGLGNISDRIRYRHVVDFIDVHVYGYHWPTFNVADSCLSIIMAWLVINSLRKSK